MDWDWLTDFLDAAFAWLIEVLLWVPHKLYELFLAGVLVVLEAIPVPDWAEGVDLSWMPSSMSYFLQPFNLPLAVACVTGAYLTRFLIRRIPVIG